MESIYKINGLVFWTEDEIKLRKFFEDMLSLKIKETLLNANRAWAFHHIEAPLLTPRDIINQNYTNKDIWAQEKHDEMDPDLVLRPETTPGSYQYAQYLMENFAGNPPLCVWQSGKSFRREQDQVSKNMRLKEFYQMELQCIFTSDTLNDYQALIIPVVEAEIRHLIGLPTRVVDSERLPSYSLKTVDVEVDNGDKWMEVCSISKRTDFKHKAVFQGKKGVVEKDLLVLEVAIGLDRLVYNYKRRK